MKKLLKKFEPLKICEFFILSFERISNFPYFNFQNIPKFSKLSKFSKKNPQTF